MVTRHTPVENATKWGDDKSETMRHAALLFGRSILMQLREILFKDAF